MIAVVAGLAALAGALAFPPPIRPRYPRRGSHVTRPTFGDPRVVRAVTAAAGVIFAVVWGGWLGIIGGAGIAIAVPVLIGRLESRATRTRREQLQAQAAVCADLLASCLVAGAPLTTAASAVADAVGPPAADHLRALVGALNLGADPAAAWRAVAGEPVLAPLARAAARSTETGAPLAPLLVGIADDLRRTERSRGEAAARAAGVRVVGPLAACFLPAFLLLGVVPIVVSLAQPLLGQSG